MRDFLSSPGSYTHSPADTAVLGNRQEDLVNAWFTSLAMTPTQRGGQLVQPAI
jgi:hypothetical protein